MAETQGTGQHPMLDQQTQEIIEALEVWQAAALIFCRTHFPQDRLLSPHVADVDADAACETMLIQDLPSSASSAGGWCARHIVDTRRAHCTTGQDGESAGHARQAPQGRHADATHGGSTVQYSRK